MVTLWDFFEESEDWDVDEMKQLLDAGADPNEQDLLGMTPLHITACRGCPDLVKLLIERGADLDITNRDGRTPLFSACTWSLHGDSDFAECAILLLDAGADPTIIDDLGYDAIGLGAAPAVIVRFRKAVSDWT